MAKHEHRWMFLTTKKEFEPLPYDDFDAPNLLRMVEYAYMICNGCENVVKDRVKTKEEVGGD